MSGTEIHSTAIVDPNAQIGSNVKIGPYSIIGPNVQIGDNCILNSHVILDGHTTIGPNNHFYQFCSIGAPPQDLSYKDEPSKVVIGENNVFREAVSLHRGTTKENLITEVGSHGLFMAYVHFGHDSKTGDNCVIANSVNLAGHVKLGSKVVLGGGIQISQFVTIGDGAYVGGASAVDRDILPYCTAVGNRVKLKGVNIIGLRRLGYSKAIITEVVDFLKTIEASAFSPRSFVDREEFRDEFPDNEVIQKMITAIRNSEVGIASFGS